MELVGFGNTKILTDCVQKFSQTPVVSLHYNFSFFVVFYWLFFEGRDVGVVYVVGQKFGNQPKPDTYFFGKMTSQKCILYFM